MRYIWLWFLARFRLSESAVCEMSKGTGVVDFHDYGDDADRYPHHMTLLKCRRCGKEFII